MGGDVIKRCHDCKFPPLCTPFMYTAVGNLLPAQHFIPPVALLYFRISFFIFIFCCVKKVLQMVGVCASMFLVF